MNAQSCCMQNVFIISYSNNITAGLSFDSGIRWLPRVLRLFALAVLCPTFFAFKFIFNINLYLRYYRLDALMALIKPWLSINCL